MHLIVNPAAAGGRVGKNWPRLCNRLKDLGLDLPFTSTEAPGHATQLAAEAASQGADVVVAVGGDGTICEVVEGLHAAGRGALGILPLGTGNDTARTLGIPLQLEPAVRALLAGHRRRVDLMKAGEHIVVNAIGIGLLGAINLNATEIKFVRGIGAYLVAAVATLFRYRCPHIVLESDEFRYDGPMTILAIHNGPTTGGGFRLCPNAVPDDGVLDATLVCQTTVPTRLGALVDAIRGTLARKPFTQEIPFKRMVLKIDERQPWHWDGNPAYLEQPGVTFEVLPKALEVVVPRA